MRQLSVCVDMSANPLRYGVIDTNTLVIVKWYDTRDGARGARRELELLAESAAASRREHAAYASVVRRVL
jgi:hypothetical protein